MCEGFPSNSFTRSAIRDGDPRGRSITVVYHAILGPEQLHGANAGDDAADVGWFPIRRPPPLAFDHKKILGFAAGRLRTKIRYGTAGFRLLPRKFTLAELQRLYETILRRPLDKRNFRRKVLSLGILRALEERKKDGPHRLARLYAISEKRLDRLKDRRIALPL